MLDRARSTRPLYSGSRVFSRVMVFADSEPGSELAAALTSLSAAVLMPCSYRWRDRAVSWPPARKPLEAAVLASASER